MGGLRTHTESSIGNTSARSCSPTWFGGMMPNHGPRSHTASNARPVLNGVARRHIRAGSKGVVGAAAEARLAQKDLPNSVKHLNDRELSLLIAACLEEAKRRGRLSPSHLTSTRRESVPKRSASTGKSLPGRKVEVATMSLTRGQVNAVRAAFKAGIKPAVIARQFGISQSDVRKVLASTPEGREPR